MTDEEIELVEGANPRDRTLREIFDRNKAVALDCATKLRELTPHLELELEFDLDDDRATDDERPMSPSQLAKALCAALETIERLKLIWVKELFTPVHGE
jgi:hypothetical protein